MGPNATLPPSSTAQEGRLKYGKDTKSLYVDDGTANVLVGGTDMLSKSIASGDAYLTYTDGQGYQVKLSLVQGDGYFDLIDKNGNQVQRITTGLSEAQIRTIIESYNYVVGGTA
jgi:hypothetical protein